MFTINVTDCIEINPEHPKWEKNLSTDYNCCVYEDLQQHWKIVTLYQSLYMVVLSEGQADRVIDIN